MPDPLVSIATPSLNQARLLLATLRSVSDQDCPAIEHIVVDGGSTDGSIEILERFAEDHRIKWLSEPDGGQPDAIVKDSRSLAARSSRGSTPTTCTCGRGPLS